MTRGSAGPSAFDGGGGGALIVSRLSDGNGRCTREFDGARAAVALTLIERPISSVACGYASWWVRRCRGSAVPLPACGQAAGIGSAHVGRDGRL